MAKITPKTIVERHSTFPEGTEQMIEYYANMKVKEHLKQLIRYSSISHVPINNVVVIVSDYEIWNNFNNISPFTGIDINVLEMSDKKHNPTK